MLRDKNAIDLTKKQWETENYNGRGMGLGLHTRSLHEIIANRKLLTRLAKYIYSANRDTSDDSAISAILNRDTSDDSAISVWLNCDVSVRSGGGSCIVVGAVFGDGGGDFVGRLVVSVKVVVAVVLGIVVLVLKRRCS
ncbi:hypothetical protein DPMN_030955 [Dreissena polymorpha]|uniref:Uncharacterized protein n=1 Tax=Dreissena polymorpha TaxID=45954 RepID=A0A9D4M001_DREPO|nr:hypothetical protein DPMN_030955 [Dreissena polymorpha]